MKNHIKQTGSLLLYTVVFNAVSFVFYFVPAFFSHNFNGIIWIIFGIIQILFTVVYFSKIPLSKVSYEKGLKADLLIYFVILSALSIAVVFYRFKTDSWFTYIFFNTFYPFALTSLLDNIKFYIFLYISENAIKTYCLYRNVMKKSISATVLKALTILIIVMYFLFAVVLLPVFSWSWL